MCGVSVRSHFAVMKLLLLLAVLSVGEGGSSSKRVAGRAGGDVRLPCGYVMKDRTLTVCWNRGTLPVFKCNNLLIATDGLSVREDSRGSSRYQLLGRLDQGDVSLTILNVTESDAGLYGCKVDIPGWFNDEKHHFDLTVDSARSTVSDNEDAEDLNAPHAATEEQGSDVTNPTEPMVALVQVETSKSPVQQPVTSFQTFIGNTLRLSFIIFIPVSLLTAAYRVWRWSQRPETDTGLSQSEEEEGNTSV